MSGGMSKFQKRADKILRANGWKFHRYSSNGYRIYQDSLGRSTTVSSSPKNETDSLKQVCKYAGIKR